eukprot:13935663-Alexandrium_andersonii.AAC.1
MDRNNVPWAVCASVLWYCAGALALCAVVAGVVAMSGARHAYGPDVHRAALLGWLSPARVRCRARCPRILCVALLMASAALPRQL